MDSRPQISVVMAAHNAHRTIGLAVSSLQMQTFRDWELIVVDDGSTDSTGRIVNAYEDERVRVVRQDPNGAASARNVGMGLATGRFIAFLDADDMMLPTYLERSMELLSAQNKTIVTNNAYFLQSSGLDPRAVRHGHGFPSGLRAQQNQLLRTNFVSIMSVFPAELLNDVGAFDASLRRSEDWDFWLRSSFAGWRFIHQRLPLAIINRTQLSMTSDTASVNIAETEILEKALARLALTRSQVRAVQTRLRVGHPTVLSDRAIDAARLGRYRKAARLHWNSSRVAGAPIMARGRALAFRLLPSVIGPIFTRKHSQRPT